MAPIPGSENQATSPAREESGEEEDDDEDEDAREAGEIDDDLDVDGDEGDPGADGNSKPRKRAKKEKRKRVSNPAEDAAQQQPQPLNADDMANFSRLKLTKRYIADALEFIRQVEGSIDVLGQLLGSTSKAEVLESIEFFKVAHEYQMAGASVSFTTNLLLNRHLSNLDQARLGSKKCCISSGRKIIVVLAQKKTKSSKGFDRDSLNAMGRSILIQSTMPTRDSRQTELQRT